MLLLCVVNYYVIKLFCVIAINHCLTDPCGYGECENEGDGYECDCLPGFTGDNCHLGKPYTQC